ncbi:hypothetical protein GBK05_10600 [Bifidobacterium longum]|uniref:Uncharacterized protein n=1 Tax=Bifidobacterium longum TaxID=216816 RepID=A0A6I1BR39_BIFLN|nr:hypothetical protein GBK09_10745 [Bifidobacterium longum]KAB6878749.1 hypothetical protein GBK40_10155 [Bifidobacterium longum]KAB6881700.1 hypothetical protein GBK07_10545 [Bifidobacterium longum]KAB6882044.1 hypothetical protein GBK43_10640 [Bifidobacterium longum]KAB6882075.1 hypothetical protein GBK01_10470 [Bifidobacterium longum]
MDYRNMPSGTVLGVRKFADLPKDAYFNHWSERYTFNNGNAFSACVTQESPDFKPDTRKLTIFIDELGEYVLWRGMAFEVRLYAQKFRKA